MISSPSIDKALSACKNERTAAEYRRCLTEYSAYLEESGKPHGREAVHLYMAALRKRLKPTSINQQLAAIKFYTYELWALGAVDDSTYLRVKEVKSEPQRGQKQRVWLTSEEVTNLLHPGRYHEALKGLRNRAAVAVMVYTGMRREEAASLQMDHWQKVDGRWIIANLRGKHARVRSIVVNDLAKEIVDAWLASAGVSDGFIFRPIDRSGNVREGHISGARIWQILTEHAEYSFDKKVSPHVLRYTYARLAHRNGASIEQIQLSLGHKDIKTTMDYIGAEIDLEGAPSDALGLGRYDG